VKDDQSNGQQGKDTNIDPKQKENRMIKGTNKIDSDSSKTSTIDNDDDMGDESAKKTNDSVTRKEHNDTDHDHKYKTPGDGKMNQNNNESKTNENASTEQNNGKMNDGSNKSGNNPNR